MIFKIIGAILIVCVAAIILKQYKSEYSILLVLTATVVLYAVIFGWFNEIIEFINELFSQIENGGIYLSVLLKAFATAIIAEIAADICRDSGESALAAKIQLAAKIAIVIFALPIFKEVLKLINFETF